MAEHRHKIALITDSTCDVPRSMLTEYGIIVIPLYVIWGSEAFRDGIDLDSEAFYARLARDPVHPTTSQPTPADFVKLLEQAQQDGAEEAVIIAISDRLSGTLDSARQAATMVSLPVHMHDSRSVSTGLGWQVIAAARAREAGADAAGMIAAAERVRQRSAVVFTVDTLEYLHKGGRIGAAAKLLGTALQLKPQLIVNTETGIVEPGQRVRTRNKAIESVYNVFFESVDTSAPLHLNVMHIAAEDEAQALADRIRAEYNPVELYVSSTAPVLGVHGGPGTVGIGGYAEG